MTSHALSYDKVPLMRPNPCVNPWSHFNVIHLAVSSHSRRVRVSVCALMRDLLKINTHYQRFDHVYGYTKSISCLETKAHIPTSTYGAIHTINSNIHI